MKDSRLVIDEYGTKRWLNKMHQRHRLDGPAFIHPNGLQQWCVNGKLHRMDGPAITYSGGEAWYVNDKLHRLDGPAIAESNIQQRWYIDGEKLSKEQFDQHPLVIFYRLTTMLDRQRERNERPTTCD
jgi:hypothetical protein